MKRILITLGVLAALAFPAAAVADGNDAGAPSASVESVAVVVLNVATTVTNFNFDVRNCSEGEVISITWAAEQPSPGTSTGGEGLFIFSTGDSIQHFVVSTVGGFRPGYGWTGEGVVTCGAVVLPIAGSGQTKSVTGV